MSASPTSFPPESFPKYWPEVLPGFCAPPQGGVSDLAWPGIGRSRWRDPWTNACCLLSTISVVATPRKACADTTESAGPPATSGSTAIGSRTGGTRCSREDPVAIPFCDSPSRGGVAHQSFGPKKVDRFAEPDEVPADSTAGKILKRNHLVRERPGARDPRAFTQSWSTSRATYPWPTGSAATR